MDLKGIKLHDVLTCSETDSIKDVAKKIAAKKERRAFVVDSERKLAGVITTTDLVYKALAKGDINLKVKDIMTSNVRTVELTEDLDKALEIMNSLKSFVCPVTKDGKIQGVISYHDLMGYVLASIKK